MSFLIAKLPQVLETENFDKTLNIDFKDTGNSMGIEEMKILSAKINMEELRQYRIDVGKRTQEIIKSFTLEILNTKVSKDALEEIRVKGAVLKDANWLLDFWGNKKIAGIVLMPLTRHIMVHINKSKCLIKKRNKKSRTLLKAKQHITADKREIKNFPKLPSATSCTRGTLDAIARDSLV